MLYLYPNSPNVRRAKLEFSDQMFDLVLGKIDSAGPIDGLVSDIMKNDFIDFICNNLEVILFGRPADLLRVSIQARALGCLFTDFKNWSNKVFDYDWFIRKRKRDYCAYDLASALDVRTCTYCNRNYTNTIVTYAGRKVARAQFDHYFDKGTHPILALSFYNLIPCCSVCNSSVKNVKPLNLDDYSHPYVDDLVDTIKFSYRYSDKSKDRLHITVGSSDVKAQNSLRDLATEELYSTHTPELADLLKTHKFFSDRYLTILRSGLLAEVHISDKELYRLAYGSEFENEDFQDRPLSKFKKDILVELGII